MNSGNAVQVTDQLRRALVPERQENDDFGVVRLAIEMLRVWRFLVLFHGDTLDTRVAFYPCSGVRLAVQNQPFLSAITST
jgi:hypothetical protein